MYRKFCYSDESGEEHCHCFAEDGSYAGFESGGILSPGYSHMTQRWIREGRTADDLKPFLESAGFAEKSLAA